MLDFSTRKLAITNLMMLTVSVLWGVAWPVGRHLATDLLELPFTVMFLRYSFAVPILFVWMWAKEGHVVPNIEAAIKIIGLSVISFLRDSIEFSPMYILNADSIPEI